MWCQVVQTTFFIEGNDEGAELNQRPFIIQEPGGEYTATVRQQPAVPTVASVSHSLDNSGGVVREGASIGMRG